MRIFKTAFYLLIAISAFTIIYQAKAAAADIFVASEAEINGQAQEICQNIRAAAPAVIADPACAAEHSACVENFLNQYVTRISSQNLCVFTGETLETKCPTRFDFGAIMGPLGRDQENRIEQACVPQDPSVDDRDVVIGVARARCEQLLGALDEFPSNGSSVCGLKRDRCTADLIAALNPEGRRIADIDLSNDNMRDALNQVRRGIAEACTTVPAKEIDSELADTNLIAENTQQATGGCTLAGNSGSLMNLLGLIVLALPIAIRRRSR